MAILISSLTICTILCCVFYIAAFLAVRRHRKLSANILKTTADYNLLLASVVVFIAMVVVELQHIAFVYLMLNVSLWGTALNTIVTSMYAPVLDLFTFINPFAILVTCTPLKKHVFCGIFGGKVGQSTTQTIAITS